MSKKTKKWYSFKSLSADSTEIYIYDEIGDSFWAESISAKEFITELSKIKSQNINLRISSNGGSVFDANAMYNALKQHPAHIIGIVDAAALSAASVVLMAADEIQMPANAMLMIHSPWAELDGNARELRKHADVLDKVSDTMVVAYKRSGLPDAEINSIMAAETWYNAEEAVEKGFADKIIEAVEVTARQNKVFASLRRYKNIPKFKEVKSMGDEKEKEVVKAKEKEVVTEPVAKVEPQESKPDGKITAMRREQERVKEVRAFADNFSVEVDSDWIADDTYTGEKLRKAVAKAYKANSKPLGGGGRAEVGADSVAKIAEPMAHGLLMRAGYNPMTQNDLGENVKAPLAKGWDRFRGMSLVRMAGEFAEAQGVNGVRAATDEELLRSMLSGETRIARNDLSIRGSAGAITSDDFPNLLNNVVNQVVEAYTFEQTREWLSAVRVVQMNDFRERVHKRVVADGLLGEGSNMDKWPLMQFDDSGESWKIKPYGIKLVITLDALLGDDFGILTQGPLHMMRGMFASERFMFYDFLNSTDLMSDGLPLFHADHGNLAPDDATRGVRSSFEDALDAADLRMSEQKYTVKGNDIGYLMPKIENIFISHKDKKIIRKLATNATLSSTEEPDGYSNEWFSMNYTARPEVGDQMICVANPNEFPCIEAGWLMGNQSLRMGSQVSYTGWQTETAGWTAFGMGRVGHVGIDKTVVSTS